MRFSPRNWGTSTLLLSWCAYWVALGVATLRPALESIAHVSRSGVHRGAVVSLNGGLINLTVYRSDGPAWTDAVHFTTLVMWVFGPPLLLWVLWAVTRPRRDAVRDRAPLA